MKRLDDFSLAHLSRTKGQGCIMHLHIPSVLSPRTNIIKQVLKSAFSFMRAGRFKVPAIVQRKRADAHVRALVALYNRWADISGPLSAARAQGLADGTGLDNARSIYAADSSA